MARRTLGQIVQSNQAGSAQGHIFLDSKNKAYEFITAGKSVNQSVILGYLTPFGLRVSEVPLMRHFEDIEVGLSITPEQSEFYNRQQYP